MVIVDTLCFKLYTLGLFRFSPANDYCHEIQYLISVVMLTALAGYPIVQGFPTARPGYINIWDYQEAQSISKR